MAPVRSLDMDLTPHVFAHGAVRLRRLEGGAGEPLILLNGYAATAADWDPGFLEELIGDDDRLGGALRVICPDHRGIGGSDPGEEQLGIDLMAGDAGALADELGLDDFHLAGWSMGGFVAQELAAKAPERVRSLTLLATDPGGPDAPRASDEAWSRLTDHTGTPREQASRLIALLFPPAVAAAVDAEFGELVAAARAELPAATLTAQEEAMRAWHAADAAAVRRRLASIDAPVLCVHGELDEVIPAANARLLAELVPGARAEMLPGAGHALMAQEPAHVARLIRARATAG